MTANSGTAQAGAGLGRLQYDVVVLGAGAAGMMCAAVAAQRGRRVVLIDHAARLAEKIRISGGGRCNFTNLGAGPSNYLSANPAFCRSALAGYTPQDFLGLLRQHRISWHEKHKGQLFCDDSSEDIIRMLRAECDKGGVRWRMETRVDAVRAEGEGYALDTSAGVITAHRVVVATGGMAIPQLGATDFGLKLARQWGLKIIEPRPALVPLVFDAADWKPYAALSGVAVEVGIATGAAKRGGGAFLEDLLFTHRGLSGPAVLQISSFWEPGQPICIDLAPALDMEAELLRAKPGSRQQLGTVLAQLWPRRLAEHWLSAQGNMPDAFSARLADVPDRLLRQLAQTIQAWQLVPSGTAGYKKAEVMRGGLDTRELNQKTMEARRAPGLHFIGEAVDVTGWLGGYNFQWAWASGVACGKAV